MFFIVLDLRLTKGWDSAHPLFLFPYVFAGKANPSYKRNTIYSN